MRNSPTAEFQSAGYLAHNAARLSHLHSLNLPWRGKGSRVLELGAGIGDHTDYWLSQGANVTAIEGRPQNAELLQKRHPGVRVITADLRTWAPTESYDCVYAYGVLYHLSQPDEAIARWAAAAEHCLLLETCVCIGDGPAWYGYHESLSPSAALDGYGCRPNRNWLYDELRGYFPHVYMPVTQPVHDEFPLDWSGSVSFPGGLQRAIYCCFRQPVDNPLLVEDVPLLQTH